MWQDELWAVIEGAVFSLPPSPYGLKRLYNPYSWADPAVDRVDAPQIRQENLHNYVQSLTERPEYLLVGEAPGWRGCRFSGVPFTSEAQLCAGVLRFSGRQSSRGAVPLNEISAQVFWDVLLRHHQEFFVWNSIPLHPAGAQSCSNRSPLLSETRDFLPLLVKLHTFLRPARVVGIGRRACWTLNQAGIEAIYVRHPAHGGAAEFRVGIESIFTEMTDKNPTMHPALGKV